MPSRQVSISAVSAGLLLFALLSTLAFAAQLNFKPGFNLFTVPEDAKLGKQTAAQVEAELPVLEDETATRYLNQLGRSLTTYAPNPQPDYVWQFKVLNSADINAFALPGGYIYVNRATIECAASEAQLAGVLAHEEGHVVMRHGTHQASEAMLAEKPLDILSGFFGQDGSLGSALLEDLVGAGIQSLLLKNSRSMEAQADSVGTYILYHAGYDPHAMAQFFEIIKQKYPGQTLGALSFLSNHPDPGNRVKAVDDEVPQLGPAKSWLADDRQFEAVRAHVLSLPPPPPPKPKPQPQTS
ncbi:MAG TPA: M48 family metallopeptidase [Terriglobia bacterium]|jgi:predicted Zn-dependent protease|nr:M48 family metallopeptidase [Terriglobia bacterium]